MRTFLSLAFALAVATASAQSPTDEARRQQAVQQVFDAQAQGAASAVRAGDEDMSCEALQAEIVAIAQSPAMQNFAQGFGAQAQADLAKIEQAQAAAAEEQARAPRRGVFRSMVQGAATAFTPGLGQAAASAQQAAAIAQNAQLEAETNRNVEAILGQAGNVAAMAGPAMRGQRVFELAQARNCAWLQGGAPPGAIPPGAIPSSGLPPGAVPPGLALPPQPGSALPPQPGSAPPSR